jgi:hypothetical protein
LPLVRLSEPHRIELNEVLFRLCHARGRAHRANILALRCRRLPAGAYAEGPRASECARARRDRFVMAALCAQIRG